MKGWSITDLKGGLQAQRTHWEALNTRLRGGHPLLCLDNFEPLVEHFAGPADRLAVHRSPWGVDALVALTAGPLRWQSFKPSPLQLSPTLFSQAAQAATLMRALPARTLALDLLCLDPLDSHDHLTSNPALGERSVHATTIQVRLKGDFCTYWSQRPKRLQGDIQNKLNRLQKDGVALEVRQHTAPQAVAQAVRRYAELEGQGWKAQAGTAVVMGSPQGHFYDTMMQRFAARQAASVFELLLDGRLAASQMTVRGGGMSVHLKTTHDETLGRYAPGYLLGYHILQHEFEAQRVDRVEYYTDADAFKLRWGTAARNIHHDRLFRHAMARGLVNGLHKVRHWGLEPDEPEAEMGH